MWVSDIIYIITWIDAEHYRFCYLSLVLDAYSEEIVGWCVGEALDTEYPINALEMVLHRIDGIAKENVNLIHHSDRGCQYASSKYVKILKGHGIKISMTESGDPKDNAQAERINNTMKNELLWGITFHDIDEVIQAVAFAVKFYNEERPHMSIDMKTPEEAALCVGEITKRWISYRENSIKDNKNTCTIPEKCLPLQASPEAPFGLRPPVTSGL